MHYQIAYIRASMAFEQLYRSNKRNKGLTTDWPMFSYTLVLNVYMSDYVG